MSEVALKGAGALGLPRGPERDGVVDPPLFRGATPGVCGPPIAQRDRRRNSCDYGVATSWGYED